MLHIWRIFSYEPSETILKKVFQMCDISRKFFLKK